jgi:hypothetical protein
LRDGRGGRAFFGTSKNSFDGLAKTLARNAPGPSFISGLLDFHRNSSTPAVLIFVYLALQLIAKRNASVFYWLEQPAHSARNAVPETVKYGPGLHFLLSG